ncbi:MAG: 30S ribosomal protein S25e [Candidatus Geothermarchaeales archaeon]
MGGQKRPTLSTLKKKAMKERQKEGEKKAEKKKKTTLSYQSSKELEERALKIIENMRYVTPYLLSLKVETKLSKSRKILRRLSSRGKIELAEKNGDVEIYNLIEARQ